MKLEKRLSPRKQPVQDRSIFLVEAIHEAAIQIFAEKGYRSTTTTMIAKRAGISVGSLYQYYPNKDAIIVTIMLLMVDVGLEQVIDAFKREESESYDPIEILRIFTEALVYAYLKTAPLLKTVLEDAPHPQKLVYHFHEAIRKMAGRLEMYLSRCGMLINNKETNLSKCIINIVQAAARWYALEALHALPAEEVIKNTTAMIVEFVSRFEKIPITTQKEMEQVTARKIESLRRSEADLFELILDRGGVSMAECDALLPQSRRTLQRNITKLVEAGLIQAIGSCPTDPRTRYKAII